MKQRNNLGFENHDHTQNIIMVCVTMQKTCELLIAEGEEISKDRGLPLHVVHAVKTGENFLNNQFEGEALEYLFTAAQISNGSLAMLRTDNIENTLAEYARAHSANVIVLGNSPQGEKTGFAERLKKQLTGVEFYVVNKKL